MAEIEFTIHPTTGQLEVHVKGIRGPSCQDVAKIVEDLVGKATVDRNTPEYLIRSRVRSQIQPRRAK